MSEKTGAARILVWDVPTRVFHWLLVLSFAAAYLTGDSERWRDVHVAAGYSMAGLLAFRLVWGLIGTRGSARSCSGRVRSCGTWRRS
jgi:cytochrome b